MELVETTRYTNIVLKEHKALIIDGTTPGIITNMQRAEDGLFALFDKDLERCNNFVAEFAGIQQIVDRA